MCKIIYRTHVSLDGLIEFPGSRPDWVIADEELFRYSNNLERQVGGYLWGRGMYENNQALWATVGDPVDGALCGRVLADFEAHPSDRVLQHPGTGSRQRQAGARRPGRGGHPPERAARPGPERGRSATGLRSDAGRAGRRIPVLRPANHPGRRPAPIPGLNEAVRLKLVETHTFHTGIVYLRYQR